MRFGDLLLDYSKNRITAETMGLLHALAREARVRDWIARMFAGARINGRVTVSGYEGSELLVARLLVESGAISEEQLQEAYKRFLELADRKKHVTAADLTALVENQLGTAGDTYDRYLVRMAEFRQSLRIIRQAMEGQQKLRPDYLAKVEKLLDDDQKKIFPQVRNQFGIGFGVNAISVVMNTTAISTPRTASEAAASRQRP